LRRSRKGRYHLSDPYFRFYFRFLAPYHDVLTFDPDRILSQIEEGLRAFVGQTSFEEISREWVAVQGKKGALPFKPEVIGSHWSASAQVDVIAINWHEKHILLGECKWGAGGVNRQIVRDLIETKPLKVMTEMPDGGANWQIHHAIFSRGGITPAASSFLREAGGFLVDLKTLEAGLAS
jgi:hypothetical protein